MGGRYSLLEKAVAVSETLQEVDVMTVIDIFKQQGRVCDKNRYAIKRKFGLSRIYFGKAIAIHESLAISRTYCRSAVVYDHQEKHGLFAQFYFGQAITIFVRISLIPKVQST